MLEINCRVVSTGTERVNLIHLPNTDSGERGFLDYCGKKVQNRPLISEIVFSEAVHAVYEHITEIKNLPRDIIFYWRKVR